MMGERDISVAGQQAPRKLVARWFRLPPLGQTYLDSCSVAGIDNPVPIVWVPVGNASVLAHSLVREFYRCCRPSLAADLGTYSSM